MRRQLLKLLSELDIVKEGKALLATKSGGANAIGVSGGRKTAFLAGVLTERISRSPILLVVPTREEVRSYRRDLSFYFPQLDLFELYPENLTRIEAEAKSREVAAARTLALRSLSLSQAAVVLVTAEAVLQKMPSAAELTEADYLIRKGDTVKQNELVKRLGDLGYERVEQVEAWGQFCLRGEIMDIYPLNLSDPVRLEWFDQTVEELRSFAALTQKASASLPEVEIMRVEAAGQSAADNIFSYLGKSALLVVDEPLKTLTIMQNIYKENPEDRPRLWEPQKLREIMDARGGLTLAALAHSCFAGQESLTVPVRAMAPYNRNTEILQGDLRGWLSEGLAPVIMMSNAAKATNLSQNFRQWGLPAIRVTAGALAREGQVCIMQGELTEGFRFWGAPWLLLTENDIFGVQKRRRFKLKQSGKQIQFFAEIKTGDYVVHAVHGIGRYLGVETLLVDDVHRDYLLLAYAGEDKLYVPVEQVGLLHKYIGNEDQTPRLSKMGGSDWQRVTRKAKAAITELAAELLRIYAQRKIVKGYAFAPESQVQREFEDSFPFEETPDQLKACAEIKKDMEKPVPMDRLLCGDVGYGKTEVAVRAAFKAVMDGKQVAVLVPTTVLAQQHLLTFRQRMEPFGVRVEMVSRFRSPKEQRQILAELAAGKIDILIGTHRLLQTDIQFPDLGLLIVDEEQRFGVSQKEKIKKMAVGIDVLTLSATPIPRTLHLALVNGRDMSIIESPPEDRLPVETYIAEYNEDMLKEAVEREVRRGGQIYYVHNRVNTLPGIAAHLRSLVPGLDVRIAHGQMPEELLENTMVDFYEGKFDMLLSTTIIENGLDVPLANTIIIDGADKFGLSQLYQMRGRVGRSSRLAYAYFLYKKEKVLSEIAEKRLEAIKDFTELGAGFRIAMRDLEIRGAGNLLGPQQHGHIAGIGFAAYCELLDKTIMELKTGKIADARVPDPIMETQLDAYIPDEYIENPRYKLEIYRRLADLDYQDAENLAEEIRDRFGAPPPEVLALWQIAKVRSLAREIGIVSVVAKNGELRVLFAEHAKVDSQKLIGFMQENRRIARFKSGLHSALTVCYGGGPAEVMAKAEEILKKLVLIE